MTKQCRSNGRLQREARIEEKADGELVVSRTFDSEKKVKLIHLRQAGAVAGLAFGGVFPHRDQ